MLVTMICPLPLQSCAIFQTPCETTNLVPNKQIDPFPDQERTSSQLPSRSGLRFLGPSCTPVIIHTLFAFTFCGRPHTPATGPLQTLKEADEEKVGLAGWSELAFSVLNSFERSLVAKARTGLERA